MEDAPGREVPPAVVLDTNAVLDWLLFGDAAVASLAAAVRTGRVRWLACPRMREELARAAAYPALAKWLPDSEHMLTEFDRWTAIRPPPAPSLVNPVCTDTDDQVFIDLALAEAARWLVTRDHALLKLARKAAARGVRIVTPAAWTFD